MVSFTERLDFDKVLSRLDKDKAVLDSNKEYIRDFNKYLSASGKAKEARRRRIVEILRFWAKLLKKDFKKAERGDIEEAVCQLQEDKVLARKLEGKGKFSTQPFKASSKELFKAVLRQFYKHLEGDDEEVPKKVRWIQVKLNAESNKLPEDIYSEEEVKKMLELAGNARNRALLSFLYESGCRASECLGVNMRDISYEKMGYRVLLNGKTGSRKILLVLSIPYLRDYLKNHPKKEDPSAPLWFSGYGLKDGEIKRLSYESLKFIIKAVGKKAGIKKRLHAHGFRHSSITHAGKALTDAQRAVYFGHAPGSKMLRKYSHMSGSDCDDAILALAGKEIKHGKTELANKICNICGYENASHEDFCGKCGRAISEKALRQENTNSDSHIQDILLRSVDREKLKNEIKADILKSFKKKK